MFGDEKNLKNLDSSYRETWRLPIAAPAAELSVGVIDPGMHKFTYESEEKSDPEKKVMVYSFSMKSEVVGDTKVAVPPKGTLVFLHGIMMTKEAMLPWAMYFAQQGYRTVVVDLRGHGRSTGKWIGFGAWETEDLTKLADELERRALMVGKLGVFGVSYGAVMGLHWAAADPRLAAVVALEPFSDPQKAIVEFTRGVEPKLAALFSEASFSKALVQASAMAGFKWNDVSVVESVKRMRVPVRFFHGRYDTWIRPEHSAELLRVAKKGSVRTLSNDNHMSLALRFDTVGPKATAWFDEKLSAASVVRLDAAPVTNE